MSASPLAKRLPVSPSPGCAPDASLDEDASGACDVAELPALGEALSFFPRQAHAKTARANRIKNKQHLFSRIIASHPPYTDLPFNNQFIIETRRCVCAKAVCLFQFSYTANRDRTLDILFSHAFSHLMTGFQPLMPDIPHGIRWRHQVHSHTAPDNKAP